MTAPFSFPTINPGQPIMEPGMGAQVAGTLADVLAAQQKQQEQQYRMQQLAQQQAQQQALAQYYQGTLDVQNREQMRLEQSSAQSLAGAKQRGQALDSYYGVPQPSTQAPGMPSQPSQATQPGNVTQDPTAAGLFKPILSGAQQSLAPAQGNPDVFGTSETAGKLASALQGVAPENVEGAIGAIQATQPKPEELPTSAKEFQYAVGHLNQIDPSGKLSEFYIKNWVNKGPQTVVNNIPAKVETKFGEEMSTVDAKAQGEALDAATKASTAFPSLNEAYRLMKSGNVITGLGAKQVLGINRVLSTMGVDTAKLKVTDTQTATKLLRDGVLAQLQTRALGSGTAVSDKDREYMEQVQGADLTQQPDAIKHIIRINVGLGVERMVTAKMMLQQQIETYPGNAKTLQVKINQIDRRMAPIWKSYQQMLADEAKQEANQQMQIAPIGNSLFPVR